MNKNGLALAADSAVTLGPQNKVFHSADKLFRLSASEPVAVMTFGAAEFLGIPWETISEEVETVGGEIDVATLSKGDGFVWVKCKDLAGRNRSQVPAALF